MSAVQLGVLTEWTPDSSHADAGLRRSVRLVQRRRRRAFEPAADTGPYRLPPAVRARLVMALASFRNAEAALALTVFLARYWSSATRLERSFPIDRRALAGHRDLGLTEAQVRGAIMTLERIGFLDRSIAGVGSQYRATEEGLRRKPIVFVFGSEFQSLFVAANQTTNRLAHRRHVPSQPTSAPSGAKSPKNKIYSEPSLIMGDQRLPGIAPATFNNALEAVIARWQRSIENEYGLTISGK